MNLLPAFTGSLLGRFRIRVGAPADVKECQRIARREIKSFLTRPALVTACGKRELYVATIDERAVGFAYWHKVTRGENAGWNVLYDIAVDRSYQHLGIGRALLYAVPTPVRLKCPAGFASNAFYVHAGMTCAGQALTRGGKALNVYERRILTILCAGNNRKFPAVARASGMAYGTRHDDTPRDWPYMVDVNWRAYDWNDYLLKIQAWRPVMALTPDYETRNPALLRMQIACLKALGVLRVAVCPKFDGAVADIPHECIVAVSVPTNYAGFVPHAEELRGRDVHLLGGSPVQWLGQTGRGRGKSATGIISAINSAGARVISADGNSHTDTASSGGYWLGGRWQFDREPFTYYELCNLSGRNITTAVERAATVRQYHLWEKAS